jgi:hypothetical protein
MNRLHDPRSNTAEAQPNRAGAGAAVKTLAKSTALTIVGSRIVPGVVIGAANFATMVVSSWILCTVLLGLSPYWRLLSRRAARGTR